MSISTIGLENAVPMQGVDFPDKNGEIPVAGGFIAAHDDFISGKQGTEALDVMFGIGREAEFQYGTTTLTDKAKAVLDARIKANTDRDLALGNMKISEVEDFAVDQPLGWRARVRSMMRRRNDKTSLRERIHDTISDENVETGVRNRLVATLLIGAIATGAAIWNSEYEKGVVDAKPRTEEVRATAQPSIDEITPGNSVDLVIRPTVTTPPKSTASQEFHQHFDNLGDTGKEEFKDMIKWEVKYIDNNNLEQDPKRGEKAANAFVRGLRYMKSLTKRVR